MDTNLDAIYSALSDGTRRDLLHRLAQGDKSISELAQAYDMSLAGVSKHVKVLQKAGLVSTEKRGRVHHCRFHPDMLKAGLEHLESYGRFWNEQLDHLQTRVEAGKHD